MGVKHLLNFVSQELKEGLFEINMKSEIEDYMRIHNKSPTLLINYRALVGYVCPDGNSKEILSGGRYQIYAKRFNDLFSKLKECGAELIFFNDGPSSKFKTECWCNDKDKNYEETVQIFDEIYDGVPLQKIVHGKYIPNLKGITEALEPEKFGKLLKPLSGLSRNNTMATYASKHKVFALLSDDSDFLIMKGSWKFWSLKEINCREMSTKEYNKQLMKDKLGMNDRELAMLATIAGNDYVKFKEVMNFHRSLGKTWKGEKFYNIARYIKSYPKNMTMDELVDGMSQELFRDKSVEHTERIRASLLSYTLNLETKDEDLFNDFENEENYLKNHLLNQHETPMGLSFIDLRMGDMPSFYGMIIALYKRQQGILWKHRQNEKTTFKVISKRFHDQPYETIKITPEYPQFKDDPDYPGTEEELEELLYDREETVNMSMKLKLLIWIINSKKLTFDIMESILSEDSEKFKEYFHPALTLFYLVERKAINVEEADKILWTIKSANQDSIPDTLKIPEKLNGRAFRISFLFSQMYVLFKKVLLCSGLEKYKNKLNFDSVFFHVNFNNTAEMNLDDVEAFRFYKF